MIGSGEVEFRAVASAVRSAVAQARLNAGVNLTGLLIDIECADDEDFRRHFMCWQLTRVLSPSLTEMVPPAAARELASRHAERSRITDPEVESGSVMRQGCVTGA